MLQRPDAVSDALEAVISRFAALVRHAGLHHGLADDDVAELIQEVRIRLWRARGDGEQIEATPASYVYRTAVTAALDLIRRSRARREEPLDVVENRAAPGSGGWDQERDVEGAETAARIAEALELIPATRRPVVRMHLAGYTREEIASLLGWSEAKTRNLLYRGLADLRARLSAHGIATDTAE